MMDKCVDCFILGLKVDKRGDEILLDCAWGFCSYVSGLVISRVFGISGYYVVLIDKPKGVAQILGT